MRVVVGGVMHTRHAYAAYQRERKLKCSAERVWLVRAENGRVADYDEAEFELWTVDGWRTEIWRRYLMIHRKTNTPITGNSIQLVNFTVSRATLPKVVSFSRHVLIYGPF